MNTSPWKTKNRGNLTRGDHRRVTEGARSALKRSQLSPFNGVTAVEQIATKNSRPAGDAAEAQGIGACAAQYARRRSSGRCGQGCPQKRYYRLRQPQFRGLLLDVLLIIDGVTAIAQPHANGYHFQKPLPAVGWEDKLGPQSCAGARPIQLPDLIRAVG